MYLSHYRIAFKDSARSLARKAFQFDIRGGLFLILTNKKYIKFSSSKSIQRPLHSKHQIFLPIIIPLKTLPHSFLQAGNIITLLPFYSNKLTSKHFLEPAKQKIMNHYLLSVTHFGIIHEKA